MTRFRAMSRFSPVVLISLGLLVASSNAATAQEAESDEEAAAAAAANANNPLADITAVNLQNYYYPKLYGLEGETANTFWLRGAQPTGPILWRLSIPFSTVPSPTVPGTDEVGLGDTQLFGAYLISQKPQFTFGVGPQLAFPTAASDALGSGKWQGGVAAVVFSIVDPRFQIGGLLLWQASFAGDKERDDTNIMVLQPFAFWQLGGGTYLRSAPLWAFDLKSGNYNVPFGFGIGQVVEVGRTVFNVFIEPQFTILHDGVGSPAFGLYTALNMQFKSK